MRFSERMSEWRLRLRGLVLRRRLERDLDDEVAFHLAMRRDSLANEGSEAARLARRQFGNVQVIKEQTRDMWTFPSFESLMQDIRYALRMLRRTPGFSVVAIAALAIGIGANSAIFSLMNAVVVQGVPFKDADRLVVLIGNVQRQVVERRGNSYPDHIDWQRRAKSFDAMAAYIANVATLRGDSPERLNAESVTSPYFSVLGVSPAMGRTFSAEDDDRRAQSVILSDGAWRSYFGADASIIGRRIALGLGQVEVIGVMPPGFAGATDTAQIWLPWSTSGFGADNRGARGFQTVAKLRRGVGAEAAAAEMAAISAQLAAANPTTNDKRGVEVISLSALTFAGIRDGVTVLMAAVAFVLLIACANVATLMVSRAEVRAREIALRTALGAGHTRLIRQLITESCVLAMIAAAAGLALAAVSLKLLVAASPITLPSYVHPSLQWPVVVFTMTMTLGVGVLLGLAPAAHSRISRLAEALKSSTRGSSAASSERLRRTLVIVEVALTVALLIGAGLMIRTLQNLSAVQPGFNTDGLLAIDVSVPRGAAPPPAAPGAPAQPAPFAVSAAALLDSAKAIPGVADAALVSDVPLTGNGGATFYAAEGDSTTDPQKAPRAYFHRISPGFFTVIGVPFRAGRTFESSEISAESTAIIVSENLVRRFWPGQDGIGKRIKTGGPASSAPWLTIVGVIPELKYRGLPNNPTADPDLYFPMTDRSSFSVLLRSNQPLSALEAPMKRAVQSTAFGVVAYNAASIAALVREQSAQPRFMTWLLGIFAAAALVLAAVGLYGMMSYLVSQRSREFGIRLALGAGRASILSLVLSDAARMVAIGLTVGAACAWALAKVISTQLFQVTAYDPSSIAAIGGLAVIALLACAVPAFRATRVDPTRALRNE